MERIIYYTVIAAVLIAASVFDIRKNKVNNVFSIVIAAAGIIMTVYDYVKVQRISTLLLAVAGAVTGFIFTVIPALKGGIGGADVKIITALGLGLGIYGILYFLLITFLSACVFQIIKGLIRKIKTRERLDLKSKLPLVPFMLAGLAGAIWQFL